MSTPDTLTIRADVLEQLQHALDRLRAVARDDRRLAATLRHQRDDLARALADLGGDPQAVIEAGKARRRIERQKGGPR